MKNKKLKELRISRLSKGKVKGIGLFEESVLKIKGHIDGRRNLPRECGNGQWVSSLVCKQHTHKYAIDVVHMPERGAVKLSRTKSISYEL